MANFPNPQGLKQLGNTNWAADFQLGHALSKARPVRRDSAASSRARSRASNVDLTTELVNMITAQRAFQANAQAITTANQLSANRHQHHPLAPGARDHGQRTLCGDDRREANHASAGREQSQHRQLQHHRLSGGRRVSFDSEPIYGPGYATRVNAVAGDAGTDFSTGTMESTGRDLDIAVNGKGFIAVQRHRRQGSLHARRRFARLAAGRGHHGQRLAGVDRKPALWSSRLRRSVSIGSDGTVSAVPQGSAPFAVTQVDRIKLVNPPTTDLQKGDDGLLRLKSGGKAKTDDTVSVTSGMLESSNVNAAQSLISMIELQRLYEFQIKSINSTDTNEQSAERMMLTS